MTTITIRVQARGGMFLGQDSSHGAYITLKDVANQKTLCSGYTDNAGSGSREPSYGPDESQYPIVTPPDPYTIHWLSAKGGAVKYVAELDLTEPTLIEFTAKVPLPPEQGNQTISMTQWVSPDYDPSVGPGFILVIPGLWVQPNVDVEGTKVSIKAKVTMMCGCEINTGAPWVPGDFTVSAVILPSKFGLPIPLDFEGNSQYITTVNLVAKGKYQVAITGYQKSTGNTGVASTTFVIE